MNEQHVISECVQRLSTKYKIVSMVFVGSLAVEGRKGLDVDACAIVREDVCDRARLEIDGIPVDLFVYGAERLAQEIEKGLRQHLLTMLASGRHVYGGASVTQQLVFAAKRRLSRPPPAPSLQASFAHRSRPQTLLKKFHDLRSGDPATAGLVLNALIQSSVDAFFTLNRIWTVGIRERMQAIADLNPMAAEALRRVMETPLSVLRGNPEQLDEMVVLLVGEKSNEETWIKGAG